MDNSTSRQRYADWLGPQVLAAVVLAMGLGMTFGLWRGAQHDAMADLQADFDYRARELMNNLALRMTTYTQVLRGVQGLFASSTQVTRREFFDYTAAQELETHFPGVAGIGYIELVTPGSQAAHVAAVRRDGFPDYGIRPSGTRPQYAPVTYLEPASAANRRVLGFDTLADPVRRTALEQARDSGQAAMSGKITLLQDGAGRGPAAFLVVLPVYANGALHVSLEQRRAAIRGWVSAPFRVGDLMAGLGGERSADLSLEVYDGEGVSDSTRMLLGNEVDVHARVSMSTLQRISVAGHRWTVAIGALPSFDARLQTDKPRAILAYGLPASALLTILTWLLARSRAAAAGALGRARLLQREQEASQKRLASLADTAQRSQMMMRSILDSTIDAILVDNGDRRVLASNQRFRELWSVPAALDMNDDDAALIEHMLAQLMHAAPFLYSRSLQHPDGKEHRDLLRLKDGRFFEQFTRPVRLGADMARLWSFRDITERKQIEQRERSHRHVLELLARGAPLHGILDAVVLGVEATNPGMLCAIGLLDGDTRRLLTGAAPSLPQFYNEALNGLAIGEGVGSCGAAAASGARVIAEDIASHPYWADFRELAARARLASCWSEPIRGGSGKILGTFAIYHHEVHYPSPANVVLIEQAAQLAGIAIEQAQAAQALRAGEERFRSLYDNAPVALWEQDWSDVREACALLEHDGVRDIAAYLHARPAEVKRIAALVRILDVNGAALAQVGAAGKDLFALGLAQNFDDSAMPQLVDAIAALAGGSLYFACESSFQRLDGGARQNELTLLVMPGHAHSLDFVIVSTVDITERKRMDAELLILATTDFLTGLPNRREFMARLDDELARIERSVDDDAAVLMLDLDHFKTVNDRFGHAMGDAVLRHLAGLMRMNQRKIDTLGRVGGEEFAVLLPGADAAAAGAYAERLRQRVAETPLVCEDGQEIRVTVSIGIASIYASDASADAALIRADKALYSAKEAGRNRVFDTRAA
ncbi:MAG: CHASE domain-containing protein [Pseudomonadota bacterium]